MANKRIIDQTTDTALSAGDMVIVDSSTEGTRKYDLGARLAEMGDLDDLETTYKSDLVGAINEAAQSGGGGGGGASPYTSDPEALGTADPGSSSNYSRGDHVHPMPSASDVGALPASTTYVSSVNGSSGAVVISDATTSASGLMSATDKGRLDDLYADYSSALTALGVV